MSNLVRFVDKFAEYVNEQGQCTPPTIEAGEVLEFLTDLRRLMVAERPIDHHEVLGWCLGEICQMLDNGIDPRTVEVPSILDKMKADFRL